MAFSDSVGVTVECGGAIRMLRICGQRREVDIFSLTESARLHLLGGIHADEVE